MKVTKQTALSFMNSFVGGPHNVLPEGIFTHVLLEHEARQLEAKKNHSGRDIL
jgi:hypothetical protein